MIHPRGDWTSTAPSGSSFDDRLLRGVAIHWQGVYVDPAKPTAEVLRADRAYHVSKGWGDIAYNLAVDLRGDVWIARGLEVRSTANGSAEANREWGAIVFLLGPGQVPTPAMEEGGRTAVWLWRNAHPRAGGIATHNDVRPQPTQCPGAELTAMVRDGSLNPEEDLDIMDAPTRLGLVRLTYESLLVKVPSVDELAWQEQNLKNVGLDAFVTSVSESAEGKTVRAKRRQVILGVA